MKKQEVFDKVASRKPRSAWGHGVIRYAMDILQNVGEYEEVTEKALLDGARDWKEYSYGGCALVYDGDICERLCAPSEKRLSRNGELAPNNRETWLDVQARALYQAARLIMSIAA